MRFVKTMGQFGRSFDLRIAVGRVLNTLNLGYNVAVRRARGSAQGIFLDFNQTDSVPRTMRMRLKFSL